MTWGQTPSSSPLSARTRLTRQRNEGEAVWVDGMDDVSVKSKPIKLKMLLTANTLSAMGPESCLILALSVCSPLRKAASQTWEHISGEKKQGQFSSVEHLWPAAAHRRQQRIQFWLICTHRHIHDQAGPLYWRLGGRKVFDLLSSTSSWCSVRSAVASSLLAQLRVNQRLLGWRRGLNVSL